MDDAYKINQKAYNDLLEYLNRKGTLERFEGKHIGFIDRKYFAIKNNEDDIKSIAKQIAKILPNNLPFYCVKIGEDKLHEIL